MITGHVNNDLEPAIQVSVRGPARRRTIEAVIDTGFNAWLSLPRSVVSDLGLHWHDTARATLADDSEVLVDIYDAKVQWHGIEEDVHADAGCDTPLIGMSLLRGSDLRMCIVEGGEIAVEPSS